MTRRIVMFMLGCLFGYACGHVSLEVHQKLNVDLRKKKELEKEIEKEDQKEAP